MTQSRLYTHNILQLQGGDGAHGLYRISLIKAGHVLYRFGGESPISIPLQVIKDAVDAQLFEGTASFMDHSGHEMPSMKNLCGIITDVTYEEDNQQAVGTLKLYTNVPAGRLADTHLKNYLRDQEIGEAVSNIGFSIVFALEWAEEDSYTISAITFVESADLVFSPGREGRVLNKQFTGEQTMSKTNINTASLNAGAEEQIVSPMAITSQPQNQNMVTEPTSAEATVVTESPGRAQWLNAEARAIAASIINRSNLPKAFQNELLEMSFDTPAQLQAAIESRRAALADAVSSEVVSLGGQPPRGGAFTNMMTGRDQFNAALSALLLDTRPGNGVLPLAGIRDAYLHLTGDYEMTGRFNPTNISLAAVDSATFSNAVAEHMNQAILNHYEAMPDVWFNGLAKEHHAATLHDIQWLAYKGIGYLPTVGEGQQYDELAWGDNSETSAFVKKGGYLGFTLEAIDKNQTGLFQSGSRSLARAAWLTIGKAMADVITTNGNLADGTPLFDASRNNINTLTPSYSNLRTLNIAMKKQEDELPAGATTTAARLGAATAFWKIITCTDLADDWTAILASSGQTGTSNNDENTFNGMGSRDSRHNHAKNRVVEVPHFTSTSAWYAIANPALWDSLGVGYRFGREPEVMSLADNSSGLIFTNDTLPLKLRWFFAVTALSGKGLHQGNA